MAAKYLALLLASLALASALPQLWPLPARYSLNASALPYPLSPCDIDYQISSPLAALVNSTINHYLEDVFRCSARGSSNVTLRVVTLGRELNFPL